MQKYRYFRDDEIKGLDMELCAMLDRARGIAGVPFVLTSTVRSPDDNSACGGVGHSSHIDGLAVDIGLGHLAEGYERDHARRMIRKGLEAVGFTRFGSYTNHIHVDIGQEPTYTQNVEWFSAAA